MESKLLIDELVKIFIEKIEAVGYVNEVDILQLNQEFETLKELAEPVIIQHLEKTYYKQLRALRGLNLVQTNSQDFGGLTGEQFNAILQLDSDKILRSFSYATDEFREQLIKGLFVGEDYRALSKRIVEEVPMRLNWMIAATDATKDMTQAVLTEKVFSNKPEQKFILNGPIDSKTRCQCKAVLAYQPKSGFTVEEINNGAWTKIALEHCPKFFKDKATGGEYTWTFRGGFNCRHYAEPVEDFL